MHRSRLLAVLLVTAPLLALTGCPEPPAPAVVFFAAEPTTAFVGDAVRFAWRTENAESISLGDGEGGEIPLGDAGLAEGSIDLAMTRAGTQRFTLHVVGVEGTTPATASVEVTVQPVAEPVIEDFAAEPGTTVATGTTVVLSWRTRLASSVSIEDELGNTLLRASPVTTGLLQVQPRQTTTYRLTAHGRGGSSSAVLQIQVVDPPAIDRLELVPPGPVDAGVEVTLHWQTHDSDRVVVVDDLGETLIDSTSQLDGALALTATRSAVYTLTAYRSALHTEASTALQVRTEPVVDQFVASVSNPVVAGSEVTLAWQTTRALQVQIVDDSGNTIVDTTADLDGAVLVNPTVTTTYTLTAVGLASDASAALTVDVLPVPAIERFVAAPDTPVAAGSEVTLSWRTADATRVILAEQGGTVLLDSTSALDSSQVVTPTSTRGYTLTASGPGGSVSESLTVTVAPPPVIDSFVADPAGPLPVGGTLTLSWTTSEASRVVLSAEPGGVQLDSSSELDGSVQLQPVVNTTYTLTASSIGGEVSATLTVNLGMPVAIDSFTAAPAGVVSAGSAVTLSWQTSDADHVLLTDELGTTLLDSGSALDSGLLVQPLETSTYTLAASHSLGGDASAQLTVEVALEILHFAATASLVHTGAPLELRWHSRGGSALQLADDGGELFSSSDLAELASGSYRHTAPGTPGDHALHLTLGNRAGSSTTAHLNVAVTDGPIIASFTASLDTLTLGDSLRLDWAVSDDAGGVSPTLALNDDQGGSFDLGSAGINPGFLDLSPSTTGVHLFTLDASTDGTTPASASVRVEVVPVPEILAFTASEEWLDSIDGPFATELSWATAGGAALELWALDGAGQPGTLHVDSSDPATMAASSATLSPTATTRYRLVLHRPDGGTVFRELLVHVDAPRVLSFVASPATIAAGSSTELSYTTSRWTTEIRLGPGVPTHNASMASNSFVDIRGTGAEVALFNDATGGSVPDEGGGPVAFPGGFTFPFMGLERSGLVATTNGQVLFDVLIGSTTAGNKRLPATDASQGAIVAPFWDDLYGGVSGTVFHDSGNDGSRDYVVVQWSDWRFCNGVVTCSPSGFLNFQVVLYDDGEIELLYGSMTSTNQANADGGSASIGVSNATGTAGLSLVFNTPVPGGLSDSGWSLVPLGVNDSFTVAPTASRSYRICAANDSEEHCADVVVTVQ